MTVTSIKKIDLVASLASSLVLLTSAVGVTTLATGCGDPLAGPDYPGEPLVSVHGTVENPLGLAPGDAADGKVWLAWRPGTADPTMPVAEQHEAGLITSTEIEASFPASFVLDVLAAPAAAASIELTDSDGEVVGSMAFGQFAMLSDAQLEQVLSTGQPAGFVGVTFTSMLFVDPSTDLDRESGRLPAGVQHGFNLVSFPLDELECRNERFLATHTCEEACTAETECGCNTDEVLPDCVADSSPEIVPLDTPISLLLVEYSAGAGAGG